MKAIFLWALMLGVYCSSAYAEPPSNVIVILADDLGIVDINGYAQRFTGAEPEEMYYETPNLDRMMREGMSFSQAYACQLCSPTRASLLTGKYAARMGFTTAVGGNVKTFYNQGLSPPEGYVAQDAIQWKDRINIQQALLNGTTRDALAAGHPLDQGQDEVTIAEAMPNHDSVFIGKWHIGGHGSAGWQPKDQGFHEIAYYDEGSSPYFNWRKHWDRRALGNSKMDQDFLTKGKSGIDHRQSYLTDQLTEHAVDFLRKRKSDDSASARPFFMYLCHFAVHTPFQAKPKDVDYFENKKTRRWNQHDHATYAAMLRALDDSVGKILVTLEESGLDDNTLVVFISDNGGVTYSGHQ
jgi:arylsulfatase A-like enzyme